MPAHEEHVAAAQELLGISSELANRVYRWQDEEYKDWFILHRLWKHDVVQTPVEAERLFGPGAGEAVKLHVLMDEVQAANIGVQLLWAGLAGAVIIGGVLAATKEA